MQKKMCLLGDVSVGKTSLVRRFVENRFDDKYLTTIGVKISRKTVTTGDAPLNLLIWDLAGENRFHHMRTSYLHGASGAVIVCDLTRHESLDCLEHYAQHMRQLAPDVHLTFVANKVDLQAEITITAAEMADIAAKYTAPYFLTSAKTGAAVEEMFTELAGRLVGS